MLEPHASGLIFGPKPLENRGHVWHYRGDVVIHAGLSVVMFTPPATSFYARTWRDCPADTIAIRNRLRARMGCAIGIVNVYDCVPVDQVPAAWREWASGPWCLLTRNRRAFRRPFQIRGQQGLWSIDDAVVAAAEPVPVPADYSFLWSPPT
jgi:hypothetical protein